MSPKVKRQTATRGARFSPRSSTLRRFLAQTLAFLLFAQAAAPPALAAPARELPLASFGAAVTAKLGTLTGALAGAVAARVTPARPAAQVVPGADFGLVLMPLNTAFSGHVGIEHHQPLRSVVVSSNSPSGSPHNFESLDEGGTHRPFSNVGGLTGGLRLALARDDGQGLSLGGFQPGELLTGTGTPGVIARVSADGASVQNPWVTLPGEVGQLGEGLTFDRTGVFGGDLIAVTTTGGVWRISSAGAATRIADLSTPLKGVTTIPDSAGKYGPWAGKILAGATEQGTVYAIDAAGNSTGYQLGVTPGDIRVIPAHENFYGVDTGGQKIWGAPDDAFNSIIGDILIAQESPGVLAHVRWNGAAFEVGQVAQVSRWGQIAFSPAGVAGVAGVKQFYDKIAVVRHAPVLDSGRVEGTLWQLAGENVVLDGTDVITSDLLVPGTPTVTLGSGRPTFGGVIEGVEGRQPTGYTVTLSNNAALRHVITRTDPFVPPPVAAPPAPAGSRDLSLTNAGEPLGDPATLRHLGLSGQAGAVAVPPGTYGKFSAGGRTTLVLGQPGSTQPAVYNLEELSLSGGSELKVVGPVVLNVRGNVSLAGSSVGAADNPRLLLLSVAQGSVGVTGGGVLYGIVRVPGSSVSIGGNGRIRGTVTCDRLDIYGNGILQITESDVAPPSLNRPPTADAGPDQVITLPTDNVSLNGVVGDDGQPAGSTPTSVWTKVSGPGTVTFADPSGAVTSATFSEEGVYVLRLTASDSLLTASDEMSVEVVPRNQPPVVNAGPDQAIELPNTATLNGTATDDALPRGSTVTTVWSVGGGPGSVTFADANALSTVATFGAPGTYTLRLTADDTEFTAGDELVITVYPENQPPVVNAGPDQTVRAGSPLTLGGTATDDGLPTGSALTSVWTKVSGPGTVTFGDANSPATTATFGIEGTYVLRLSANDTRFDVSDECVVTVLPRNTPPVVNAGTDQEITFLDAATLQGTATDDGLPVGSVLEVAWSVVSGPGTAVFADPDRPVSPVTFSAPGTYVLRLTGDDTQFNASDETTVVVKPRPHASRVYTLNADFDLGSLINVTHSPADQLQLDSTTRSFNFIWVAVSTKGTVVKINTETGAIIGEYFTSPAGQPKDPSRTTVDQNGNVWATNRAGNSVVHIGLVENGQCVDRNGNGQIDTSVGFNDLRAWTNAGGANTGGGVTTAQDECILHYTRVNSSGTRHVSVNKDNDIWVSGTSGQRFDLIDGKTGLIKRAEPSVGYGGYGGLIDKAGVIWSANSMLRWDTSKPLTGPNGTNWRGYSHPSYGLCIDSQGNVWNTTYGSSVIYKFAPNGTLIGTYNQGSPWAQGCVVDRNDHVWIAHSLNASSVGHMKNDGSYVGTIPVGSGPTGVAVDGAGKVWATNYYSGTVSRINPAAGSLGPDGVTRVGAVDFTTPNLGGNPYNYSDMTGSTLTGAPQTGTWSVVYDSQLAGAEWGRIGWTAQVCGDGLLTVTVATSENNSTYTQPVTVSNGDDPVITNGRYLRVVVRFERASSGESPVLYDLTVGTVGFPFNTPSNVAPGVDAGPDQTLAGGVKQTELKASACDDALPSNRRLTLAWSQISGPGTATFAKPDSPVTGVTFSAVGTYTLRLTATDSVHTSSDTLVVTVIPGNQAPTVNAGPDVTVESCQATLHGTVTDDGMPAGGSLLISWSKLTGPGVVTFANASAAETDATFTKPGVYVLRLSAGDGALGTFDDVSVTVRASGAPLYYEVTNYLSAADSPFQQLDNNYFHLENFEDHLLNTPGVTASAGGVASVVFGPTLHDSVDGDDGTINGSGLAGDNFFSGSGAAGITFTFNAAALGSLPTHAGLVWTDGAGTVTFEAFDAQGVSMGLRGPYNFPDAVFSGTTAEDRFLGAFNRGGISRIKVTNSIGGLEIDHLQYGSERSANNPPSVSAGDNQFIGLPANSVTLNGTAADDGLPPCASLTYAWSKVSGPGTVTFANPAAASTTATFGTPGIYVLRLTAGDSELSSSDEVTINFSGPNQTPQVDAGPDQSVAHNAAVVLNGIVNDDGLPQNAAVTSSWSMLSGPGSVGFADASSSSTTATFSEAGTYVLRLTASDTALTAYDETVITVTPPNRAPVVNAGVDLGVTLPAAARLNGVVTDDGLPLGAMLTVSWGKVSGPGAVTFADAASASTTAGFAEAGTYVLRLTAGDTELTGADEVTVTVKPFAPNQGPSVDAGPDQSVVPGANLIQNGGADEQLVGGEIRAWTEAAGTTWTRGASGSPESVNGDSFFYAGETATAELRQDIDVSAFAATIAAGTQAFEWLAYVRSRAEALPDTARVILEYRNASNTALIARLDSGEIATTSAWHLLEDARPAPAGTGWIRIRLMATRRTGATNDAYFDALSLRAVTGAGVKLNGSVTDDGLPAAGTPTTNWTKVSGPGAVTFADASAATTSATFAEAGTYVLRLTASDSELTSADEVTVTVEARNLAPVVEAGADQTVTLPATAALSGTVTDDGKPSGAAVTSSWSKVSGPGTVTFSDPNAAISAATFSAEGTYVLRLSASDTEYGAGDTVTITVMPVPPNQSPRVDAGADQLINPPANNATLSGTVTDDGKPTGAALTYLWTKVSGPGAVTFSTPAAASTTATFAEPGVYVLRLTASDTELSGSDDVRVTLNGTNKAPTVDAGADQTVAHPTTVTLAGTANDDGLPAASALSYNWGVVSGPGSVTFANSSAAQTTVTFGAAGTYVLRLSASDSELTAADDVTVTQTTPPAAGITSPADGATINGRTVFVGTVGAGTTWRLEYSLNEEGVAPTWTTISSGGTPVTNGPLGTFDPTVLLNGIYTVRLVATNGAGQTTTTSVTAVAEGEQKVGNFRLSFTDLDLPVAGIPIQVIRSYDSRDKRTGDFGVGWTLDIRNARVQESGAAGAGWQGTVGGGFLRNYCIQPTRPHLVSVTMPDNKVLKFEATLSPQCSQVYPPRETTIGFRALPGTNATLAPVGDTTVFVNASFPGEAELLDYSSIEAKDFSQYRLTLPTGEVMLLDQRAGLQQMTDANGNTLNIGAGGITHSSGKSVVFTRDAQGRIAQITDPAGASMFYTYDARGDLVSVKDREGNVTTVTYNSTHGLLSLKDPRGVQPARYDYDEAGRLVSATDAFGKVINFTRNPDTRQEVSTDRLGNATVYEYNAQGEVVRTTDALGNTNTRTYDSRGNMLSETNALGQVVNYTYDALGNRLTQTDPLGNVTRLSYNSRGQVLTVTDPRGGVTTNTYDAKGNLTAVKDSSGNTTATAYDAKGQVVSVTDATGGSATFVYDASGNVTRQTDPLGNVSTFTYDANNRQLSQTTTRTAGGVTETLTTTSQYDKLGRLVRVTHPDGTASEVVYNSIGKRSATVDQLGRRTSFDYDFMGRLTRTTFPDGSKEETAYDAEGHATKTLDRAGRATLYAYDALGRLVKTTYSDGTFTSNAYDARGRIAAATDAAGRTTRYEYDAAGRNTKVTDALGNATTFAYDAAGNRVSATDAKGQTTRYEFDADNRQTRVIQPDGTSQSVVYDKLGRPASKTDQAGRTTLFEHDARGKVTKVTDARGGLTTFTYDESGNPLTQTDANDHTTRFEYDRAGRRTRRTLPLGMSESYEYDAAGNLAARTDFNGRRTTYGYDTLNRLVTRTPDPATGEPSATFTYTAAGQRETMTDATGTTRYAYDSRNRLSSKAAPQGTLTYTYYAAGGVLTVRSSNANGVSVDYAYDGLSRLATVRDNRQPAGVTAYGYDVNSNLETVTYPNEVRTAYTYNGLNRLTGVNAAKGGASLAGYAYTLGAAGNRLSVTEQNGRTAAYAYDELYRLTGESVSGDPATNGQVGYTYDPVGNRLGRTSTVSGIAPATAAYDANDRLAADSYDQNGNTVGSQGAAYTYDSANRIRTAAASGAAYAYDGDGNLVAKTVGGVTTHYLVDSNNPTGYAQVVEEIVGGQVVRQYTYGHDLVSQRQLVGGQWQTSFYGYDGHGSVRYLTDASGAVTDTYTYDAFGTLLSRTGTTANDYLYAGERFDADLGLYYLRARHMNPATGRFFTQDTHDGVAYDPLSLHKYLYANANPVDRADPSGNFSISIGSFTIAFSIQSILVNMAIGAFTGALLGAVDAFLGGRNVREAAIQGGLFGAALGPLAGIYIIRAILAGVGMGISAVGAFQALMDEDYDLAAFRTVMFIAGAVITWRAYTFNNVRTVDPATLRWTQTTAGGRGRAAALRESMKNNGWDGPPIDVVETPDGLVTLDHTRAAVALELGIKEIPVRVHKASDPLPAEMITGPNGPRFTANDGSGHATTWGEAAAIRGGNQNPPLPPTGTTTPPRMPKQ